MAFPFRCRLDRRDPQRQARAARPEDAHDRYWTIAVEQDVLDRPLGRAALIARGVSGVVKFRAMPRLLYLAFVLPLILGMPAAAAPPASEWAFWDQANPASTARIEHTLWDGLLARYVVPASDGINPVPDPRVPYAVNCAALGCRNLARRAYDAQGLETMLEVAARAYVNHPRGSSVVDGKLVVSSIYVWFKDDFGGDDAGVIQHLKHYAEPSLARGRSPIPRIDAYPYRWRLNYPA